MRTHTNRIVRPRQREIDLLLENFRANPVQTRHEICLELGVIDALAADLFATMVFICDDFLRLRVTSSPASSSNYSEADLLEGRENHGDDPNVRDGGGGGNGASAIVRFFSIASKLPMELQMMLSYRSYGSSKDSILSRNSEIAFKALTRSYSF
jgi:hypothetical protein